MKGQIYLSTKHQHCLLEPTAIYECNCTTACAYLQTSGHHLLLGLQPFHPLTTPVMLLLSLSGLLKVWILSWEVAVFSVGALGYISYPGLERTWPWVRAFLLTRWMNITRGPSLLVQLWCLINKWKRQKLFPPARFSVSGDSYCISHSHETSPFKILRKKHTTEFVPIVSFRDRLMESDSHWVFQPFRRE